MSIKPPLMRREGYPFGLAGKYVRKNVITPRWWWLQYRHGPAIAEWPEEASEGDPVRKQ